jgi:DNA-binding NarL/FixJ family response regulator
MLTQYDEPALVESAIERGAQAFLLKNSTPEELRAVVLAASAHEFFENELTKPFRKRKRRRITRSNSFFSPSKLEILKLIIKGALSPAIATELLLSITIVQSYRKEMLSKSKCNNTAELTAFTFRLVLYDEKRELINADQSYPQFHKEKRTKKESVTTTTIGIYSLMMSIKRKTSQLR